MKKNKKIILSTIIGKNSKIEGNLKISGGIRIDGEISGSVFTDSFLTLSKNGFIEADVKAKECVISGKIKGNVIVDQTLEIGETGRIDGSIKAGKLIINSGAVFNGNCIMSNGNMDDVEKTEN
jgi:cytoskeletal protein CcmA (bactofilin family)